MTLKISNTFASILLTTATLSAHAVLPAVATDNTVMDNSVAVPLIPQIVPSISQPVVSQPVQTVQPIQNSAYTPSFASQTQLQIQTKLTASLVTANPQGGEMLAPITPQVQLPKGSIIEYHGYIINNTPERVKTLKATFDIPAGTELQSSNTIAPQPAYASNDGVHFNYMPIKLSANGVLQEVPMSYYKTVQWDIAGLGLNEVAEVKYRVIVK